MADDLARHLKQPPTHRLDLRTRPVPAERGCAKARIEIVGQNADGEEHRVGLERAARHRFHAEADLQILDPVLAGAAAHFEYQSIVACASSFSRLLAMA